MPTLRDRILLATRLRSISSEHLLHEGLRRSCPPFFLVVFGFFATESKTSDRHLRFEITTAECFRGAAFVIGIEALWWNECDHWTLRPRTSSQRRSPSTPSPKIPYKCGDLFSVDALIILIAYPLVHSLLNHTLTPSHLSQCLSTPPLTIPSLSFLRIPPTRRARRPRRR